METLSVQSEMMLPTQPNNFQWFGVVGMVSLCVGFSANNARARLQVSPLNGNATVSSCVHLQPGFTA